MTAKANKVTGRKATNDGWAKHLRPYSKRRANKAARRTAKLAPREGG